MKKISIKNPVTIVIMILLVLSVVVSLIILNHKNTESSFNNDSVIPMIASDNGQSDEEYTLKTNPNDDGFGTEVVM